MKNIDFSHNKIGDCYIEINVNKLAINDNDLKNITLIFDQMNYLDISNNPMLSNIVGFKPEYIDTIIRKNIKNNKKLIFVVDSWPKTID